ncbi:hypothetical protein [Leptolyngbya ohadii]|uniref:hypothetical protein n=1 Tax=Leptolyngbya ohadii TaxID=1962290 RepID=UPI0015C65886|nr:hypothetical protein [Leptolyngbya ohadii]
MDESVGTAKSDRMNSHALDPCYFKPCCFDLPRSGFIAVSLQPTVDGCGQVGASQNLFH